MTPRLSRLIAAALAVLVFYSILTFWIQDRWALSVFETGVFGLCAVWLAGAAAARHPVRGSVVLLPLGGAVAWGLLQLATRQTVYAWATAGAVLNWTTILAVFFLGLQVLAGPGTRRRCLEAALWFGFVLSVIATFQLFTSEGRIFWLFPTEYREFVMGPFVYHNHYAAFVELLLPLALVQALARGRNTLLYAVMAGVMLASVVASASRAGAALALAETALIVFLAWRRGFIAGPRLARAALMVGSLAVLATAVAGWGVLWNRLQEREPYAFRREAALASLEMLRDRPWMGFGLGTWPTVYPAYARSDDGTFVNQAHNDWLQWAAEGGLPFFLLMLSIAVWTLVASLRTLWSLGVVAVFVHCIVDYPMHPKPSLACLAFLLLAALAAERTQQPSASGA